MTAVCGKWDGDERHSDKDDEDSDDIDDDSLTRGA